MPTPVRIRQDAEVGDPFGASVNHVGPTLGLGRWPVSGGMTIKAVGSTGCGRPLVKLRAGMVD